MTKDSHLSIWFFVGILLAFYGLIITGAGIYAFFTPPDRAPGLAPRRPLVGPDPPGHRRLLLLPLRPGKMKARSPDASPIAVASFSAYVLA